MQHSEEATKLSEPKGRSCWPQPSRPWEPGCKLGVFWEPVAPWPARGGGGAFRILRVRPCLLIPRLSSSRTRIGRAKSPLGLPISFLPGKLWMEDRSPRFWRLERMYHRCVKSTLFALSGLKNGKPLEGFPLKTPVLLPTI